MLCPTSGVGKALASITGGRRIESYEVLNDLFANETQTLELHSVAPDALNASFTNETALTQLQEIQALPQVEAQDIKRSLPEEEDNDFHINKQKRVGDESDEVDV